MNKQYLKELLKMSSEINNKIYAILNEDDDSIYINQSDVELGKQFIKNRSDWIYGANGSNHLPVEQRPQVISARKMLKIDKELKKRGINTRIDSKTLEPYNDSDIEKKAKEEIKAEQDAMFERIPSAVVGPSSKDKSFQDRLKKYQASPQKYIDDAKRNPEKAALAGAAGLAGLGVAGYAAYKLAKRRKAEKEKAKNKG